MPHVSKKVFSPTSPTSHRFVRRSAITRAASIGASGMPSPFAMFIHDPNGNIPSVTSLSRSSIAAGATVPSPPATMTKG